MSAAIEPSGNLLEKSDEDSPVESLPKEAGLFLLMIGVGGILLPGPIGTPFIVLSAVVLFPNLFRKVDAQILKRFPKSHRQGMKQVKRFVSDLERRYPSCS